METLRHREILVTCSPPSPLGLNFLQAARVESFFVVLEETKILGKPGVSSSGMKDPSVFGADGIP
jgi:hypothetical protein